MARAIAVTEDYVTSRHQRKKVEMLFAHLKRILKLVRLRLRGPNGARDEFHLVVSAARGEASMEKVSIVGLIWPRMSFRRMAPSPTVPWPPARRSCAASCWPSLPSCLVGMEACASAHYWAREIAAFGHDVRLIAPIYVKPFVKRNKNDAADAQAIAEAASRPTMRFVGVKSAEQQASGMAFKTRTSLCANKARPSTRSADTWRSTASSRPTVRSMSRRWPKR